MATFIPEIQNKRKDGTYNVRIRITHNREIRRISTHLYVTDADLTRGGKIKNEQIKEVCNALVKKCRDTCNRFDSTIASAPIDALVEEIKIAIEGRKTFSLDFFEFARKKISSMNEGTANSYRIMLNSLRRFTQREHLDISEINSSFLDGFLNFLKQEPNQQGNNRKEKKGSLKPKKGRALSAYLSCIRAIHNSAKLEYNDEERGIIRIPNTPFKYFKIPPQQATRKRALSIEDIQKIIDIPYQPEIIGGRWSRFNLAKDCFLLSFALVGMNSVDMFLSEPQKKGIIKYNRTKTKTRRSDEAEMQVRIEGCIKLLIDKYSDPLKQRLFRFYKHYSDSQGFNKAINKGLKQIGEIIGVEDLEFYAARHSWATIARSNGIDKYTIHEALNHSDSEMKVTDIYIDKDWSVIWDANKKVLELFDWSKLNS